MHILFFAAIFEEALVLKDILRLKKGLLMATQNITRWQGGVCYARLG
jgi:hypothetical protein